MRLLAPASLSDPNTYVIVVKFRVLSNESGVSSRLLGLVGLSRVRPTLSCR